MQILKDLQDLCKKAVAELAEAQLKAGSLKSEVENLLTKKAKLEADAQAAFEELKNVSVKVRDERAREIQLIDSRSTDVGLLKVQTETELQKNKAIGVDLANKLEEASRQKQAADEFLVQLKAKEAAVEERLAKLEALKSAI